MNDSEIFTFFIYIFISLLVAFGIYGTYIFIDIMRNRNNGIGPREFFHCEGRWDDVYGKK